MNDDQKLGRQLRREHKRLWASLTRPEREKIRVLTDLDRHAWTVEYLVCDGREVPEPLRYLSRNALVRAKRVKG